MSWEGEEGQGLTCLVPNFATAHQGGGVGLTCLLLIVSQGVPGGGGGLAAISGL
jgi:hypothetical protein